CSRSFGTPVTQRQALIDVVSQFASRVAEKARGQQSVAAAVHVFITTSPFRRNDRQYSPSVTLPLVRPTADSRALMGAAVRALEGMYRPGFNYAKAGVMLIDLRPQGQEQGDLFAARHEPQPPRHDSARLMGALDALNRRFGRGTVSVVSAARSASGGG